MTEAIQTSISRAIREFLAELVEVPLAEIPEDADLRQELDVDSLQQLELVGLLEERFGVRLDAEDLSQVSSIQELSGRAAQNLGRQGE